MAFAIPKLRSLIPRGEFSRYTLVLVSGTVLAQAIGLLFAPVLTHLYTPADFGVLALFTSVTTLLVSISSAKYDTAIVVPKKDEDGFALLVLSCSIVCGTSLFLLALASVFSGPIARLMRAPEFQPWLYLIPPFVFVAGMYAPARSWFNRRKDFKVMASNGVWRSGLSGATSALLGWSRFGTGGLIWGTFVGQVASTWLFIHQIWKEDREFLKRIGKKQITNAARANVNFPKFLIPSGFVEVGAQQVPIMFLGSVFGIGVLGLFSLATRIVNMPLSLVGSAIGDVFRQAASQQYSSTGDCRYIFKKTLRRLFLLAIVPCICMFIFAPTAFALVFGEKWRMAGVFVQILSPMFFVRFISCPLSTMFYIAHKQRWDLITQTTSCSALIVLLALAYKLKLGPLVAVGIYSGVYCLKHGMELLLAYRFTINPEWKNICESEGLSTPAPIPS